MDKLKEAMAQARGGLTKSFPTTIKNFKELKKTDKGLTQKTDKILLRGGVAPFVMTGSAVADIASGLKNTAKTIKEKAQERKSKAPGMKAKEAARKGRTRVGAARAGAKKY